MNGRFAQGDVLHGMWVAASLLAAVVSVVLAWSGWRRERAARGRLVALLAMEAAPVRRRERPAYGAWARRWGPPLGVGCLGWALVGGVLGQVVGLACAYGVWRRLRTRKPDSTAATDEAVRQLPLAADLLAACVSAGAGPREAAEAVGESLGGPVGDRLVSTAAALRLGVNRSRPGVGSARYRAPRTWPAVWSGPVPRERRRRRPSPGWPTASGRSGPGRPPRVRAGPRR